MKNNIPTFNVTVCVPAPLMELIDKHMESDKASVKPGRQRVTRHNTLLKLLYAGLGVTPAEVFTPKSSTPAIKRKTAY
jgi:hypothetical protein